MVTNGLIFLGAGLGGVARYWISNTIYDYWGREFPYGTLFVNVSGSFFMGLLFVVILGRFEEIEISSMLRAFLLIGFLGGYTTFSAFSMETIILMENGAWVNALLNSVLSIVLCVGAAWLGFICARQL